MSIESKIRDYMKSPAGKAKLAAAREKVIKAGKTASGQEVVNEEVAARLASELAAMISGAASAVPGVDSGMECSAPVRSGDSFQVSLSFTGDLGRPSLYQGGIGNIIALFNNGYNASAQVFGEWHGRRVGSVVSRPPLHFMQQAVDEFNAKYAGKYHVTARLGGDYE